MDGDMITPAGCRARQRPLLEFMELRGWDLFVTANYRTVYYLSGILGAADVPAVLLLRAGGRCTVISGANRPDHAADELIGLETYSITRCVDDLAGDAAENMHEVLPDNVASLRCGVDSLSLQMSFRAAALEDGSRTILAMRKKKYDDEIAEIRASLRLCAAAYDAAKTMMRPGLTEIEVHSAMSAAVNREAGTAVQLTGDFACGLRGVRGGGPPTARKLESGDLYVLDLFPAPALYFGDVCRTFAVGTPTDEQVRAAELVAGTLRAAEAKVRPGMAARDVYLFVKERLGDSSWHHAGHGIGHHGHEAPRLIPGSDHIFEEGDVFTIEPGIYLDTLQGGIRMGITIGSTRAASRICLTTR
jgi:Xaa-Pro aminopeptidase